MKALGRIAELRVHPIKSMLADQTRAVEVYNGGIIGDRDIALIDDKTGKVVTAKQPFLWRKMLLLKACFTSSTNEVKITDDEGNSISINDRNINLWLSDFLGRKVTLCKKRTDGLQIDRSDPSEFISGATSDRVSSTLHNLGEAAPDGGFVDFAPIHFLTSSSLSDLCRHAGGDLEAARFRANILIATNESEPYCENDWAGRKLRIGKDVVLEVICATPRCAVPTLPYQDHEANKSIIRNLLSLNKPSVADMGKRPSLGGYARVIESGKVEVGDRVKLD